MLCTEHFPWGCSCHGLSTAFSSQQCTQWGQRSPPRPTAFLLAYNNPPSTAPTQILLEMQEPYVSISLGSTTILGKAASTQLAPGAIMIFSFWATAGGQSYNRSGAGTEGRAAEAFHMQSSWC